MKDRRKRGFGRPETFDFLGFTHYWNKTTEGYFQMGRKPVAKRMTRTLKRIKEELRWRMHHDVVATAKWLGRVVNGWLNYYAVPGPVFDTYAASATAWNGCGSESCAAGRRRTATSGTTSQDCETNTGPSWRSDTHGRTNDWPSLQPKRGAPCLSGHAGICAGGAGQPASLPRYLRQVVVRWSKEGRIRRTARGMYQKT